MEIKMNKRFEIKNLPDMKTIRTEIDKLTSGLTLGQTLFFKKHGVKTEGEYKKRCMENGHIMKHSHIGYNTWDTTKAAAEEVYTKLEERGSYIDRFGFCLDTVMGLPEELRAGQLVGTGLVLKNVEEWSQIGQIVPVQPHCGDNMITTHNSLENCLNALRAGVTTIGNASHYYTYEWVGIDREESRTIDTIKAFGVMGKFHDDGVIIHSNLDDGYGGQIQDMANLVGWAKIERYYVEGLLNGGLGQQCFGNLFSHPIDRIIFSLAVKEMNPNGIPGSMVYGNTTEFGADFERNQGALASFITGDIIAQMYMPTGAAITPIPVSEAVRIPTADEMVAANLETDMMIKKAPCFAEYLDWDRILDKKDLLVKCGNLFFERVLNGLDDLGVDIEHPGQIMGALKAIGPVQLETVWGVGLQDKKALRGRIPVKPTNVVKDIMDTENKIKDKIDGLQDSLKGVKIVIGSTDIHEFGKQVIKGIVLSAGATVFDLGSTVGTEEVLDTLVETESHVVLISTYNGIALSYAKELLNGLKNRGMNNISVIMGGLLNENLDDSELATDVTEQLTALGIHADNKAENIVNLIRSCA
ncbi:hypothetical protein FACS189468_3570 [Spirochaetia bacterium]|nr:hypothetical protein FACS189468_3570 [Spirochaetia bacterium]